MTTETVINYHKDFKRFLERELNKRCKRNPNYSLRSFAKSLDMDPSLLSKLISGKRKLTNYQIEKLGKTLGLKLKEIESFKEKQKVCEEKKDFYQLTLDQFDIISEWQHYAILEMLSLKNFRPDIKWIARQLKIEVEDANTYVECLKRVGLLEVETDGTWVDKSHGHSTHIVDKNFTSYAHKQSQKNILLKALESLDSVEIERRDQSSMMVSTSPKKIEEAKEMIATFRRLLMTFLEDTDDKTAVYQMSFSLFPLIDTNQTKDTV